MIKYKTVMKDANVEQIINKSRFIGYVRPVETRESAESFFSEIRARHKDATHNVPAYVIGPQFQLQWASDDGEPQGTSGAPLVQMLVKEGITNTALMISRYFGGVKLGTGGLVRAYTGTAKLTLEAGVVCAVKEKTVISVKLDYSCHGKLQNLAAKGCFQVTDTVFEDAVKLELVTDPERTLEVKALLSDLTGGSVRILSESERLVKVPISQ